MNLYDALGIDPDDPSMASAISMEQSRYSIMDKLVEIRQERGMTITDVAAQLGVSRQAVSKFEYGRDPRLSTLIRYAIAVGATLTLHAEPLPQFTPPAPPTHRLD